MVTPKAIQPENIQMNLTKMRLMLAIADIATMPDIISEADLAEVKAWMRKDSTGIPANLREIIASALDVAAQGED